MSILRRNTNRESTAWSDVDLQTSQHHYPQPESDQAKNEASAHDAGLPPTCPASDIWLNTTSQPKSRQTYYKPLATQPTILFIFLVSNLIFIGGIEGVLREGVPVQIESTLKKFNSTQHLISDSKMADYGLVNEMVASVGNNIRKQETPVPMSCIGIEIIVSATEIERCDTASPVSCSTTTTEYIYEKPIFNKTISTMPCYICAMQSEAIEIGLVIARLWISITRLHSPGRSAEAGNRNFMTSSTLRDKRVRIDVVPV